MEGKGREKDGGMKPYFTLGRNLKIHVSNVFREKMASQGKMIDENGEFLFLR